MTIYNNNIPQPSDRPSDSQDDLLQNFQALKVFLDRNHVAIIDPTTNTSEGKHRFLQMPEQVAVPSTADNEGALYVKEANGRSSLYFRQEKDGTEIQMTKQAPIKSATGESFLPGGIIYKWGSTNFAASTSQAVSFTGASFSAIYQVVATLARQSGSGTLDRKFNINDPTTAGFTGYVESAFSNGTTAKIVWVAIGI